MLGMPGHGPQGNHNDQKKQRKAGQEQGQRNFVRRALTNRAFHQGNHPVQERCSWAARDLHHDAVGEDYCTARDAGAVTAPFPDNRCTFARNCRFVQ